MKNISLLPAEIRNYQKTANKRNNGIFLALACISAFILVYCIFSFVILAKNGDLKAVLQQRAAVQVELERLKPYGDMLADVKDTDVLVKDAMGSNPGWGELFTHLFNVLPDNVWISGFSAKYGEDSKDFSIKGWAKSASDVSEWLSILQGTEGLSDIQCRFAARDESSGSLEVQFEIKATLLPGSSYESPVKGDMQP